MSFELCFKAFIFFRFVACNKHFFSAVFLVYSHHTLHIYFGGESSHAHYLSQNAFMDIASSRIFSGFGLVFGDLAYHRETRWQLLIFLLSCSTGDADQSSFMYFIIAT